MELSEHKFEQFDAAFRECAWLWRESQGLEANAIRALMRTRLEALVQREPRLAVRLEILRAECSGWEHVT